MARAYWFTTKHQADVAAFREALPVGQVVRGSDLAQRWNVSRRTIYRWIDQLREQGAKIAGAPGFGFWVHSK